MALFSARIQATVDQWPRSLPDNFLNAHLNKLRRHILARQPRFPVKATKFRAYLA